ncbi:zinc ribbon domain-containing protein [Halalkalicoccus subterraneus]|uniref:zinc ribbon domain-containing protein n=1 Tax=Halalkalicoccus subterraneus TaxID=2675002 RepID=UPI000EFC19F4|nr:zinc ribbon domain-containing protein [Halalkalicoccus subterraneus]
MVQISLRNNPLLAALLATAATGLGHLYLRRWLRALGWFSVISVTTVLFVSDSTLSALSWGTIADPLSVLPLVLVGVASVIDAYIIARVQQMSQQMIDKREALAEDTESETDTEVACPVCREEVDPSLSFCQWCGTKFDDMDDDTLNKPDKQR